MGVKFQLYRPHTLWDLCDKLYGWGGERISLDNKSYSLPIKISLYDDKNFFFSGHVEEVVWRKKNEEIPSAICGLFKNDMHFSMTFVKRGVELVAVERIDKEKGKCRWCVSDTVLLMVYEEEEKEEQVDDELEISRVRVISIIQFHCCSCFVFLSSPAVYRRKRYTRSSSSSPSASNCILECLIRFD